MTENDISRQIVEAAIEVHRTLGGPGLLESVYEEALVWELAKLRLKPTSATSAWDGGASRCWLLAAGCWFLHRPLWGLFWSPHCGRLDWPETSD